MRESPTHPDTTLLNVAILPPSSTSTDVELLSGRLHRLGGLFRLDGIQKFPHLTVYMARFTNAEIGSIADRTAAAIATRQPLHLEHVGYHLTAGNYYEASYARNAALMSLHEAIVDQLKLTRFSPGNPVIEEYFAPYSAEQKRYAEMTGYDLAHELYRPHVTITRFAQRPAFSLPAAAGDLSFTATTIGLFTADSLGAVTANLATWSL